MDPSDVNLLGRVDNETAASVESTPASKKKKRSDDSPKPSSKKKSSSKPRSDDLKSLDEKWSERFLDWNFGGGGISCYTGGDVQITSPLLV